MSLCEDSCMIVCAIWAILNQKYAKKRIPRPFSGQSKFLIIKFNCDNFWNFSTPTYLSGQACRFFLMKRREPQMVTISLCTFLIKYSPGVYWALQAAS